MTTKFVFIVHALSEAHRRVVGLRAAKMGLALGRRKGTDSRDVSTLCRFHLGEDIFGEVVCVPMVPEQLLEHQDLALERMHRAVKWAERDGELVSAIGLGALCSIVAGRGKGLQERVSVPVTTGNAATAWTLFQNCLAANPHRKEMIIIGSGSPVGRILCSLLNEESITLRVDSKRALKYSTRPLFTKEQNISKEAAIVVGCGPTGPMLSADTLPPGSVVIDVAIPHSIQGTRKDISIIQGERMTMPPNWKRGYWGPVYHLLSGYGWNTILACLVEPLALAFAGRTKPYAQGRSLKKQDVLDFGVVANKMGFIPVLEA